MTQLSSDITRFLSELKAYASRDLPYDADIGLLLKMAKASEQMPMFEELIFVAKFVSRTFEVMKRIGSDADGYDKLASEFKDNTERAASLMKRLLQEAPHEERQHFEARYFDLDQESFGRLMGLLSDLSWVKNWRVDGKPLP